MLVAGLAKEGAEFVFAHAEVGQLEHRQHVFGLQVQGDLQFHENHVIGEAAFRFRLWPWLLATQCIDQAVEENRQGAISAFLKGRVVVLFQPVADLFPGDGFTGFGENADHAGVVEIEDVPGAAKDVVIEHAGPVVRETEGRDRHGSNVIVQGTDGGNTPVCPLTFQGVKIFSPTMPARISPRHSNRGALTASWNSRMPNSTVPIVPMPVHTA